MPTGQQIITRAVTVLNIIDDGGGISASEDNGLLIELNAMVDAWAAEETLIPSISTAQYALTANQNPYPIGPAATAPFNVARPVRIDKAVLVSTVGGATRRRPLRIVGSADYFDHADLAAAATTADELYADWQDSATGAMNLYLFPVPSCPTATKLELETWNPIAAFALAVNQNLPPSYEDGIVYGLAYRCIPRYGAVINPAVAEVVTAIGKQAKDRIRALNVQNRVLDPALLPRDPQPQQRATR